MIHLRLALFGQSVTVACDGQESAALVTAVYGAFLCPGDTAPDPTAIAYTIDRPPTGGVVLRRRAGGPLPVDDDGQLLFRFEKDLTIELQKRRRDLYFLHAAVLERDGRCVLLVAESGGGKSTTTWGLLHHGFRYASDEMAPIDLATRQVHGYPLALCLKADPPQSHPLPPGTLRTSRGRHVPVEWLPCALAPVPLELDTIVFLRYRPESKPALDTLGRAEATARLYVQALNPLAHSSDGLDAVVEIARNARCLSLEAGALDATCALVHEALFDS